VVPTILDVALYCWRTLWRAEKAPFWLDLLAAFALALVAVIARDGSFNG
jgi:hypothetical protein